MTGFTKNSSQSGFSAIVIIFAVAALAMILGGGWYAKQRGFFAARPPAGKQCTAEAMLCPDGKTSVSRTGPNCEFAKCPDVRRQKSGVGGQIDTSNWKTYRNEKYGFEVKYPQNFSVFEGEPLYGEAKSLNGVQIAHYGTFRDLALQIEVESMSLENYMRTLSPEFLSGLVPLGIPDKIGYREISGSEGYGSESILIAGDQNRSFDIETQFQDDSDHIVINTIISTIKFLH